MTLSVGPRISCDVVEARPDVARIFNIQRYSLNDGAGIRTVVFFKGCPHRCPWCANPESISPKIETVRRESKCLHCAPCLRDADECPSGAFERIGRDVTLDELEREVMKDDVFFRSSGGGVTLSGGEVLMQAPFATQLLKRLRRYGIRTAIETAGDAPLSRLLPLARQCDEVLFDLKIMDPEQARAVTAVNLPRVLENLTQLVAEGINVIPRVPLIPGYTLTDANMARVLAFLLPSGIRQLHLLPFHTYGEPKYRLLGQQWLMREVNPPTADEVAAMRRMAEDKGFHVTTGG
ncbi:[formate-C-acetyltransferase]-activating enzyme [Enterobacter cloacae complex sp. P40RS]|uniref:[formate-C-acetyltransferase]-activating enzyme n=2 Tax=Enterobacter cloacae complex TaxID=354276 RepID=A0A7H8UEL4_ENTCL|nr:MULTISPECIES: [formate-C-acetyltransferase]-activating enzyme [Enterobacter cloacae complex]MBE4855261.1 [formate-C-acetyltransferase]-activating enzyme [Enterobacter pasteurii]MBE4865190.1 [formate-C-acetyltransferase]-activating enzyme [Enterobacter cloacae complex sp. P40C2]MBE4877289.1 [formate-C-acetyltransferase]-activating enzyme [Enterobacter cloacae complex sp. P40C]MDE4083395.1 [formate-C-acetyltransferase]-activating enzyme [Enterobacter pasteurii]QKZ97227.1 [formate-C-acetyltran